MTRVSSLKLALIAGCLAAAPAFARNDTPSSQATAAQPDGGDAAIGCTLPLGWDEVAQRKPEAVIFGRPGGTAQPPAFVADIACALAREGKHVLLGLELPHSEDETLQAAWGMPHASFSTALRFGLFDKARSVSNSQALFDAMVSLHALKEEGLAISVTAIAADGNDMQRLMRAGVSGTNWMAAGMAEHITTALDEKQPDIALVLTPPIFAMRSRPQEPTFGSGSMIAHLGKNHSVVSLQAFYPAGDAWYCRPKPGIKPQADGSIANDAIECGAYARAAHMSGELSAEPPYIAMSSTGGIPGTGEDGLFQLGAITASPPVGDF